MIRTFTANDFVAAAGGVWRTSRGEAIGGTILFVSFFSLFAYMTATAFGAAMNVRIAAVAIAAIIAAAASIGEAKSAIVIGPESVARQSPIPSLSWSIPLSRINKVELRRGKGFALRVSTNEGAAKRVLMPSPLRDRLMGSGL